MNSITNWIRNLIELIFQVAIRIDFYKLYESYIAYWAGFFGSEIYEIEYEGFTDDPHTQIQNLLANLSLPFDSACLAPHKNIRVVKTASRAQVSKKIFRNSSNEWREHDSHFQCLLERSFDDWSNAPWFNRQSQNLEFWRVKKYICAE